ncbi:hypothetical protein HDU76_003369 [Blyttiomyces sp. JEL0837]|nr:hypothetical protein HDU76_003369 [Blyttiomyces sp. JEL0837]
MSLSLLDHATSFPTDMDFSSIITKCINNSHYEVLTRLIKLHYVTPKMLERTLLDSMDERISTSKVTISENCISKCLECLNGSKMSDLDLIDHEVKGLIELRINKALQANYVALFQHTVKLLREFGVKIIGIYVGAGFHIGVADNFFVTTLLDMLVKDQVEILDYLWNMGALDSFEFGKRVNLELDWTMDKLTLASQKVKSKRSVPDSEKWTMETVIIAAGKPTLLFCNIAHLKVAINSSVIFNKPASTLMKSQDLKVWLQLLKPILKPRPFGSLITRITAMALLTVLDEWISYSKVIIPELCIVQGLDWLYSSKYWKWIAIDGFVELVGIKAFQGGYMTLFAQTVSVLRGNEVKDIDFAGFEKVLAQGGRTVEDLNGILKEDVDLFDYLWNMGALDSFEFGRRVVDLGEKN